MVLMVMVVVVIAVVLLIVVVNEYEAMQQLTGMFHQPKSS